MDKHRCIRNKLIEWARRYLPCEIVGTTCEFAAAIAVYAATGSLAAAALAATIGASVGYYAAAYAGAFRWAYREHRHRPRPARALAAQWLALRSVAVEFGPAELVDTLLVRPAAFYVGPLIFGDVVIGWIFGKVLSDIGFYVFAIVSYETFTGLLAVRRPQPREVSGESGTPIAAA